MTNTNRYARQTILPEIGENGQKRISDASILCIGAGGLGCPALLYLAAAGVGRIGIIDFDRVEETNLQRQVLFSTDQIGKYKAIAAKEKLDALNPCIEIEAIAQELSDENALSLFKSYDLIIDGTDNFASKFLINDAALKCGKPFIYASILGFEGQLAVFGAPDGPCYRCLFPHAPKHNVPSCAENGVIGAVAGILGTMQAMEAIKLIVAHKDFNHLIGKLWTINTRSMETKALNLSRDPACPTCTKQPDQITLAYKKEPCALIREITPQEMHKKPKIMLLDVREQDEWDKGFIMGAQHAPLSSLLQGHIPDLPKDREIIIYCAHGIRSRNAAEFLKAQGYKNVANMAGGYEAWLMTFGAKSV